MSPPSPGGECHTAHPRHTSTVGYPHKIKRKVQINKQTTWGRVRLQELKAKKWNPKFHYRIQKFLQLILIP